MSSSPSSSSSEGLDKGVVAVIAVVILIVTVTVIITCVQVIIRCVPKLMTVIIRCVRCVPKLMTVIIRCVQVIIRCVQKLMTVIIRCVKKLMELKSNTSTHTVADAFPQRSNSAIETTPTVADAFPQRSNSAIETTPTFKTEWNFEVAPMERFLDDFLKEKPMKFTSQQLIHITNNYAEKLGSGGFGTVYKGQCLNGVAVAVAVKVLHKTTDKRAEEQFMAEVATIGRTYHINLVRLYGFCFDASVKALVYEYMENGSLDQYLFDKNKRPRWEKQYEIAIGTAKGIRYLHEECQRRVIHYDIKPGNILLDASFSPKIADFGLAKLSDRNNTHVTHTGCRGTPGYAAPELWMPFPVTYKCDVYSYGMLLFEILGARRNFDFESQEWFPRWAWEKFEQGEMDSMLSHCGVEGDNKVAAARLFKVALWCIQHQHETRPTMSNVVRMLEGEQEIVTPMNPFLHPIIPSVSTMPGSESTSGFSSKVRMLEGEQEIVPPMNPFLNPIIPSASAMSGREITSGF